MTCEVKLTHGQVALVDDVDYGLVSLWDWNAHYMAHTKSQYADRREESLDILMHRVIMQANPGQIVDHIDHNTLDNRRKNLRLCTTLNNRRNSRKYRVSSSVHKGVVWDPVNRNWLARIGVNYRRINLGRFHSEVDAAKAYNTAALEMFVEFAYLNEIPS